jgi:hypothetical protein
MKKVTFICIILGVIMVLPFFSGCKKGEQDPFLSLRSRDGRLIKEWKLTKMEGTRLYHQLVPKDSTNTTNYSFDGTTRTKTVTSSGTSNATVTTMTGAYDMTINEDGSIAINEVMTTSGTSSVTTTLTSQGTWVWVTGNKKKDHLQLSLGGSFTLFNGGLVYVSRLSSNEMVLKTSTSSSYATSLYSYSTEFDYTYTFEKK